MTPMISEGLPAQGIPALIVRSSEPLFHAIFEQAAVGVAQIETATGRFVQVNERYCQIVGVAKDEMTSTTFMALTHPADLQANLDNMDALKAGRIREFTMEKRYCRKDGSIVWVNLTVSPMWAPEEEPTFHIAVVEDITSRKQAEEALGNSERFNKVVLDSLSAYVAALDRTGTIVAVNQAWQQSAKQNDTLGSSKIGVGVNYLEVCRKASRRNREVQRTFRGIQAVLARQRELFETEYACVTPDGQRWFAMRVTPLGGRDGGAVVTHENITARKRAEEALRESYHRLQTLSHKVQVAEERERSRLSRELHDEFGQVLSGLKFDLIDIAARCTKRVPSATVSRTKVMRALTLVDRLFVSLKGMVSALRPALLEELGLVPALEDLAIDTQERFGLCCRVVADPVQFRACCGTEVTSAIYRIVQELLNNVTRHAKATVATVTLSCSDGRAKLIVQDDGCGFRVDKVPSKGRFGLQGIRERVELLGGTVDIHSKPGQTIVTVWFLLEAPSKSDGGAVRSRLPISATARKKRRHGKAR